MSKSGQSDHVEVDPKGLGDNVVDVYIPGSFSIAAGETVTVAAYGSKNPPSEDPSGELSVSTFADTEAISVPFAIGPISAISGLNLSADTTSAGASSVLYTASFKSTSAISSGDAAQLGDSEQPGYIRLVAPQGTMFNHDDYSYEVSNEHESQQALHVTVDPEGLGENVVDVDVSLRFPVGAAAGETVKVEAYGAKNPESEDPTGRLTVSTSSDVEPGSTVLPIGPASNVQDTSLGEHDGAYVVQFASPSNVSNGDPEQFGDDEQPGFITVAASAGTTLPSEGHDYGFSVRTVDGTAEYGVLHVEVHGQTATIETAETIPGGSQVTLAIEGVTGTGLTSALISTSSDAVPVNAGAIELAPLSGAVTFEGAAVADAAVQACPIAGGTCQTTSTNGSGGFTFAVPAMAGGYALTANPPGASSHAGEGKLSPVTIKGAAGATGIELALPPAPKIAPHVKIVTSGGGEQGSATGYPFVSWASPYELQLDPVGGALLRKARAGLRANLTLSALSALLPGATTVGVLLIRQKPKPKRR